MQEHRFVLAEVSKRRFNDDTRTRQACLPMSNDPAALPTVALEPLVEQTEILATVVYLDVVQAGELPPDQCHEILRQAVTNPCQILCEMDSCIGVMTHTQQEYLPIQL